MDVNKAYLISPKTNYSLLLRLLANSIQYAKTICWETRSPEWINCHGNMYTGRIKETEGAEKCRKKDICKNEYF